LSSARGDPWKLEGSRRQIGAQASRSVPIGRDAIVWLVGTVDDQEESKAGTSVTNVSGCWGYLERSRSTWEV
jgi:hypothetical protein